MRIFKCSYRYFSFTVKYPNAVIVDYMYWHIGIDFSMSSLSPDLWCQPMTSCRLVHCTYWTSAGSCTISPYWSTCDCHSSASHWLKVRIKWSPS